MGVPANRKERKEKPEENDEETEIYMHIQAESRNRVLSLEGFHPNRWTTWTSILWYATRYYNNGPWQRNFYCVLQRSGKVGERLKGRLGKKLEKGGNT